MISAYILSGQVQSNSQEAFTVHERSSFGEKQGDIIIYMPVEALFLLQQKKLVFYKGKRIISSEQVLSALKKIDSRIQLQYPAYNDLRKKGYIPKTGLKFGSDFRIYSKGERPGKAHARWIMSCYKDTEKIEWREFASKNRVAHSTNKKMLIALIDQENIPNYYEFSWLRV